MGEGTGNAGNKRINKKKQGVDVHTLLFYAIVLLQSSAKKLLALA